MIFAIIERALTPQQLAQVWKRMMMVRASEESTEEPGAPGMRRLGD